MTTAAASNYANPFTVKLPLLRVAHASDADNQHQMNQLRTTLEEKAAQNKNLIADSVDADDSLSRDISSKGIPSANDRRQRQQPSGNPLLFDFEHYHDPELTPRAKW